MYLFDAIYREDFSDLDEPGLIKFVTFAADSFKEALEQADAYCEDTDRDLVGLLPDQYIDLLLCYNAPVIKHSKPQQTYCYRQN